MGERDVLSGAMDPTSSVSPQLETQRSATIPRILGNRYELGPQLGEGAFGVVYEAFDQVEGRRIALKTLHVLSPETLYRLKNEFRTISNIINPHLLRLYELVADDEQPFIAMELVEGARTLLEYLRPLPGSPDPHRRSPLGHTEVECIRSCFLQLARGLLALHDAGVLHRDIKPSNVLVNAAGRVVVVDFGIAVDRDLRRFEFVDASYIIGTPGYMAPETALGGSVGPPADWYSVGVMLYEALTWRPPFPRVSPLARMDPAPFELTGSPSAASDLAALSLELMNPSPASRPTGRDVVMRLGETDDLPGEVSRLALESSPFVGRGDALRVLEEAYAASCAGAAAAVLVRGKSGMGKTTLVQRFLEAFGASGDERTDPVILAGRCYARELIPYKAFDGAVDALSRFLLRLPAAEVAALLPPDAALLARVFPVLRRVAAFTEAAEAWTDDQDPGEWRPRAIRAFRQLIDALTRTWRVILVIDDLQWADEDSNVLFIELTQGAAPPPILLILAFRAEESARSSALLSCLATVETGSIKRWTVDVTELDTNDSIELARLLLNDDDADAGPRVLDVARDAGGSPFFVDQLARQARVVPSGGRPALQLNEILRRRLDELPPMARELLDVIAVAGGPVPVEIACQASGIPAFERTASLTLLQAERIITVAGPRRSETVEPYHDRIGEAAARGVDDARRRVLHGSLLEALAAVPSPDPEVLFMHATHAGATDRALEYAEASAVTAASKLAFDRAARYFRSAIALVQPGESARQKELLVRLASVLVDAGRGAEAADAFASAAALATGREQIEYGERAGEQLLGSGHLDEGRAMMQSVLERSGLEVPTTLFGRALALAAVRLRIAVSRRSGGRQGITERPSSETLGRLDTCSAVGQALSIADPLLGLLFQSRALWMAISAGEPSRLCRALALEAAARAVESGGYGRSRALLDEARLLFPRVQRTDIDALDALIEGISAMICHFAGRWQEGLEFFEKARELQRANRLPSARWERDTVDNYQITTAIYRGRLRDASTWFDERSREASDRGDLYLSTLVHVGEANLIWLFRDRPTEGRERLDDALAHWSQEGFHAPHWWAMLSRTYLDVYDGQAERASAEFDANWPRAVRSGIPWLVQLARVFAHYRRGALALAVVDHRRHRTSRASRLRCARTAGTRILREDVRYGAPLGHLLMAGAARCEGDVEGTRRFLERAADGFAATDTALWAATTRLRLGELVAGDEGRTMASEARAWMAGEGVVQPEKLAAALAPGFGL